MKTGLLFDLDGTLLDTLEDLLDATNYTLGCFGYPERTLPELRRFVGNGAHNQLRLSAPEGTEEARLQELLAVYKPYYTDKANFVNRDGIGFRHFLSSRTLLLYVCIRRR